MKRKGNLYNEICKIENITKEFEEVCRNTKNKRKVEKFKELKCVYINLIHKTLNKREYKVGPYTVFTIYEPKKRRIVSQNMYDKVINHLVARFILLPALNSCLLDFNVASREGMGTSLGLKYVQKFRRNCKIKYNDYFILKCDISKFFASINHDILKEKLKKRIKDKEALKIVFDIIDSEENGLSIGNMTSQILAIFYLNDLDHFIKEDLKIKYYVRYQDDFLIFHPSKQYLRFCLTEVRNFLERDKLNLNNKTRIFKSNNNFVFLGRKRNGRYSNYRRIKKKLGKRYYLYNSNQISLNSIMSSIACYKNIDNKETNKIIKLKNNKQFFNKIRQ